MYKISEAVFKLLFALILELLLLNLPGIVSSERVRYRLMLRLFRSDFETWISISVPRHELERHTLTHTKAV